MDKLDIWIYIILFILVPIGNALLGTKKKKPTVKNGRPVQQPENDGEEWWQEVEENWKELVVTDSTEPSKVSKPFPKKEKKVSPFLQPENKSVSFPAENYSRLSKSAARMECPEKDVYAIDKDDTFVVDNSELRKAVVMSEILAKKF